MTGGRCRCPRLVSIKFPRARRVHTARSQTDSVSNRQRADGSFRVPGEGAVRQAQRSHHTRPGDHHRRRGEGDRRGDRQAGDGEGAGQGRRPRQGGRREVRGHRRRRVHPRTEHPRPGHQGPHREEAAGRRGQRHRRGVLHLLPSRSRQPHLPGHVLGRGRHGDRRGRRHQARPARQGSRRRDQGCRRRRSPVYIAETGPPARRGARLPPR